MRVHTPQRLAYTLMLEVTGNQVGKGFVNPEEQFIDNQATGDAAEVRSPNKRRRDIP